uniref:Ig-like domain-containing protein n=1 Tax=Onchocerca volvulus TaxID=6282 RepID=A0A8R1XKC8_ONCVO
MTRISDEHKDDYNRKLKSYYRCMKGREKYIKQRITPIQAIVALRDAELELQCFRCLSPEEQTEVEEVWKPNESFIGKKIRQIIDKVKEFILSQVKHVKTEMNEWDYHWEKAGFDEGWKGWWRSVVDIDPTLSVTEKTISLIKKFMKRQPNEPKLGDHFELILPKVSRKDMGWYRCIKRVNNTMNIANMYYVDVITNSTPEIIINKSVETEEQAMSHEFADLKLQSRAIATPWSECSICDTRKGEMRRKIACHLKIASGISYDAISNSNISYMQLFSHIPCRSSLIPIQVRHILWPIQDIVQVENCYVPCTRTKIQQTRLIKSKNEFGREVIIDEIPPGEYQMNERLPPLRKAVKREAIEALENDPYILSCPQKEFGIFWALNETYISSISLLAQYPDKRIYISGDNELIINYLKLEDDESFFSCHQAFDGDVLRTFSFIVNKGKQRQEIVEYINFGIRYGAFLLIILLVLSIILNTSVDSEKYRREVVMKQHINKEINKPNNKINSK